jgi:hypothetical protein
VVLISNSFKKASCPPKLASTPAENININTNAKQIKNSELFSGLI